MRRNALLLLPCLVLCGWGGRVPGRHVPAQILVIGGADYDEPAGPLGVVRGDGTGFHWLSRASALEARWSPDGRRIAFINADNFTPESAVVVMNADGRRQRQIGREWHRYTHLLEWSPDGRRILSARPSGLWSTRADGRGERRLARGAQDAAWSPNGRSIAFTRSDALYVMRADGTGVRRIAARAVSPLWTTNGKTIVFVRSTEGAPGRVYAVATAGGKPRMVARARVDSIDDVSPDGRSLLVDTPAGLTIVSIRNGATRRVTREQGDYRGDWSPDGRRIAFVCGPDLCIVDARGGKAKRVRKAPRGVFFSTALWQPRP